MTAKKAVILFSGGLDSTTCVALAKEQGFECYALSFDYGQKHHVELEWAQKIAKELGVKAQQIARLPMSGWGGSSLTDSKIGVEDYKDSEAIPTSYVPARNTIFLAVALSYAEAIGAFDIFIGINAVDYSHYPDCRPQYLKAFGELANLATKAGVEGAKFKIHAPLLHLSKAEIVKEGIRLGVDFGKTISCYRANAEGGACGECDSCIYRKKGFSEAGILDPTKYARA